MPWLIEETDDCGVHWRRAEMTYCYGHPRLALQEALKIIKDEWRPPRRALHELATALTEDATAYYWAKGIRIVRASAGLSGRWR